MTPAEKAEIVRTHKPFVYKHAKKRASRSSQDFDDCVQEVYLAFLMALESWKPEGGANVRTYASTYLRWSYQREWNREGKQKHGGRVRPLSLDEAIATRNDEPVTLYDTLGVPASQEDAVDSARAAAKIRAAISTLLPREQDVIRQRFFDGRTLEEVGASRGVTRERARQIEADALVKLRRRLGP